MKIVNNKRNEPISSNSSVLLSKTQGQSNQQKLLTGQKTTAKPFSNF